MRRTSHDPQLKSCFRRGSEVTSARTTGIGSVWKERIEWQKEWRDLVLKRCPSALSSGSVAARGTTEDRSASRHDTSGPDAIGIRPATAPATSAETSIADRENENFRKVLFTAPHSQLVLMTLQPGEEIDIAGDRIERPGCRWAEQVELPDFELAAEGSHRVRIVRDDRDHCRTSWSVCH